MSGIMFMYETLDVSNAQVNSKILAAVQESWEVAISRVRRRIADLRFST